MSRFRDATLGLAAVVLGALGVAAAHEGSWPGAISGCGVALALACFLLAQAETKHNESQED